MTMLTFLATFLQLTVILNALLVAFFLGRFFEYRKSLSFKDSLLAMINKTNYNSDEKTKDRTE